SRPASSCGGWTTTRSSYRDPAAPSAATTSCRRNSPPWSRRRTRASGPRALSATTSGRVSPWRCSRARAAENPSRSMKITGRNIASFLSGTDGAVAAALFYGPDTGLVKERADRLAAAIVGDLADPFRVSELTPERLRDEPSLLSDEAAALTFGGGRRVVRLRG